MNLIRIYANAPAFHGEEILKRRPSYVTSRELLRSASATLPIEASRAPEPDDVNGARACLYRGWGRLGTYNGFTNPLGALDARFKTRPGGFTGTGGQPEIDKWFRGDAAFFGGLGVCVGLAPI